MNKLQGLQRIIKEAKSKYTMYAMIGHALSRSILGDYAKVIAKIEWVEPEQVAKRITGAMHQMLAKEGWAVYPKKTKAGTVPALGMLVGKYLLEDAPVPELRLPKEEEEEEGEKLIKKTRKKYNV